MYIDAIIFQDILGENLIFPYGYSAGYGIGFGAPFLLPSYLDSCEFDCSAADFSAVIHQYGLQFGVQGQHIGESKLDNFGLDAKQALRDGAVKIISAQTDTAALLLLSSSGSSIRSCIKNS